MEVSIYEAVADGKRLTRWLDVDINGNIVYIRYSEFVDKKTSDKIREAIVNGGDKEWERDVIKPFFAVRDKWYDGFKEAVKNHNPNEISESQKFWVQKVK